MSSNKPSLFATDKDLYDLLMAPRQRIPEKVMLELARDRRIFCAASEPRDDLADYISSLTHDLGDVEGLIERGEPKGRNEKTTFRTLQTDLDKEAVLKALKRYKGDVSSNEIVNLPLSGEGLIAVNVEYSDFDYSKTHLLQRQSKVAGIEFKFEDGQIRVRLPSTERAREIADAMFREIERESGKTLTRKEISVAQFDPRNRTKFFLQVMSGMTGYKAETVTRLKVASSNSNDDEESDEDADEVASAEMLHLVENVALSGENLLASPQYKQLEESGFFITAMTWRAAQVDTPHDRIQFDLSFEEGKAGQGFRYLARVAPVSKRETKGPNFRLPTEARKKELFSVIEATARKIIEKLEAEPAVGNGVADGQV